MSRQAPRRLCPLCKGSGRYPPGVCRHCHGAGYDPDDAGAADTHRGHAGRPVLGPLALLLFVALWALQWAVFPELSGQRRVLASLVLALLYGWPALFALARSVGAGAFGRSLRAALIVLAPVCVTLVLVAAALAHPGAAWAELAAGAWMFVQLVAVPASWVVARMDFARTRESASNRGTAARAER
jgi:hypothetical protein